MLFVRPTRGHGGLYRVKDTGHNTFILIPLSLSSLLIIIIGIYLLPL